METPTFDAIEREMRRDVDEQHIVQHETLQDFVIAYFDQRDPEFAARLRTAPIVVHAKLVQRICLTEWSPSNAN